MTTREARRNLCQLLNQTAATPIHAFKKLKAVIIPVQELSSKDLAKSSAAQERIRSEQMHAALTHALKEKKP